MNFTFFVRLLLVIPFCFLLTACEGYLEIAKCGCGVPLICKPACPPPPLPPPPPVPQPPIPPGPQPPLPPTPQPPVESCPLQTCPGGTLRAGQNVRGTGANCSITEICNISNCAPRNCPAGYTGQIRGFVRNGVCVYPPSNPVPSTCTPAQRRCVAGGCSGQLCIEEGSNSGITTCEWREEYACYRNAECRRQSNGQCGWTQTSTLTQCIANAQNQSDNCMCPIGRPNCSGGGMVEVSRDYQYSCPGGGTKTCTAYSCAPANNQQCPCYTGDFCVITPSAAMIAERERVNNLRRTNNCTIPCPVASCIDNLDGCTLNCNDGSVRYWGGSGQPPAGCRVVCPSPTPPVVRKPAIYLYPTKTTKVSVTLGVPVDFTVQIPKYGNKGWNLLAEPNGKLTINGGGLVKASDKSKNQVKESSYPYIYWEGLVKGKSYPQPKKGWIVSDKEVSSLISEKLDLIGFNQKEKADFIQYWVPAIQDLKAPYYQISFVQNAEIDRFVPMTVVPKPTSISRVYMVVNPLTEKPKKAIDSQELETITRAGFTVLEWGGYITGKSTLR